MWLLYPVCRVIPGSMRYSRNQALQITCLYYYDLGRKRGSLVSKRDLTDKIRKVWQIADMVEYVGKSSNCRDNKVRNELIKKLLVRLSLNCQS